METLKRIFRVLAVAAVPLVVPSAAFAQDYPSKPVTWVMPFGPGGPTDLFSRQIAQKLGQLFGQPVVVENVSGAGGSVGMDRLAKARPDGYTIGLATTGTVAINPHLYGKRLRHDTLTDFTPITLGVRYVNVLVVNPRTPANSVNELVAYAKANPEKVNFGSAGNGTSSHLTAELLKHLTGAPMSHVPYKSNAAALSDVMTGNLTFMIDILITAMPQVQAGRLRALAVTSSARSPLAPGIPTMAESGVPGFSEAGSDLWFGIFGPAGMPRAIVQLLNAKLSEALRDPSIAERLTAQGFGVWTSTPEEFASVIRSDYEKWGKIVKLSGASAD